MRTVTEADAVRHLPDLLDAVERGETVTITRGRRAVAEMIPAQRSTGSRLRAALNGIAPPGDEFTADITDALAVIAGA
jgi:antitoxin (DNA-binding transcriptional repressor) of toxin-antitoxin stability system